jgi:hypothetical protein
VKTIYKNLELIIKTKTTDQYKSNKEYLNKLKHKRMSVADTKFRSFLPGEIGNFEDDNVLSIFKNTTDSKFSLSKLSKKRISKAMFMKTKHDTDTEQTYGYKFGNSRKGSIRSKKSKLMTIRQ